MPGASSPARGSSGVKLRRQPTSSPSGSRAASGRSPKRPPRACSSAPPLPKIDLRVPLSTSIERKDLDGELEETDDDGQDDAGAGSQRTPRAQAGEEGRAQAGRARAGDRTGARRSG